MIVFTLLVRFGCVIKSKGQYEIFKACFTGFPHTNCELLFSLLLPSLNSPFLIKGNMQFDEMKTFLKSKLASTRCKPTMIRGNDDAESEEILVEEEDSVEPSSDAGSTNSGAGASAAATPRGTATSGAAAVGHDTPPSSS